mmetsp:Transcript_12045/g.34076  ORF Transcript_12045/g.34076 Transcript_12045/m.34076 type:complete len:247 (+) Transcript_12045:1887-2627(+)
MSCWRRGRPGRARRSRRLRSSAVRSSAATARCCSRARPRPRCCTRASRRRPWVAAPSPSAAPAPPRRTSPAASGRKPSGRSCGRQPACSLRRRRRWATSPAPPPPRSASPAVSSATRSSPRYGVASAPWPASLRRTMAASAQAVTARPRHPTMCQTRVMGPAMVVSSAPAPVSRRPLRASGRWTPLVPSAAALPRRRCPGPSRRCLSSGSSRCGSARGLPPSAARSSTSLTAWVRARTWGLCGSTT